VQVKKKELKIGRVVRRLLTSHFALLTCAP
jgi:hypothetical protein